MRPGVFGVVGVSGSPFLEEPRSVPCCFAGVPREGGIVRNGACGMDGLLLLLLLLRCLVGRCWRDGRAMAGLVSLALFCRRFAEPGKLAASRPFSSCRGLV